MEYGVHSPREGELVGPCELDLVGKMVHGETPWLFQTKTNNHFCLLTEILYLFISHTKPTKPHTHTRFLCLSVSNIFLTLFVNSNVMPQYDKTIPTPQPPPKPTTSTPKPCLLLPHTAQRASMPVPATFLTRTPHPTEHRTKPELTTHQVTQQVNINMKLLSVHSFALSTC